MYLADLNESLVSVFLLAHVYTPVNARAHFVGQTFSLPRGTGVVVFNTRTLCTNSPSTSDRHKRRNESIRVVNWKPTQSL